MLVLPDFFSKCTPPVSVSVPIFPPLFLLLFVFATRLPPAVIMFNSNLTELCLLDVETIKIADHEEIRVERDRLSPQEVTPGRD